MIREKLFTLLFISVDTPILLGLDGSNTFPDVKFSGGFFLLLLWFWNCLRLKHCFAWGEVCFWFVERSRFPSKSLLVVNFLMSGLRGTLWPPIDQSTATEMSQPLCGSAHWPFSLKLINLATLPFCCQSSKPKCHKKTGTLATDGEGESNWAFRKQKV